MTWFVRLLWSIPGLFFAATAQTDIFGRLAIFAIAFLMVASASSLFSLALAYSAKLKNSDAVSENQTEKRTIAWSFLAVVVLGAFIFGGTSYGGAAIYALAIGAVDAKVLRTKSHNKAADLMASDSK